MTTNTTTEDTYPEQRDAFVGRLFGAALGLADIATVYLGDRLGLYRALTEVGPLTPSGLSQRAGIAERYAREWLEQQAVAGILEVDGEAGAGKRRYSLPAAHREVLLDTDSLNYLGALARALVGVMSQVPALAEAFRTGAGVSYEAFGADAREGQAAMNRPVHTNLLAREWLPAIADVHARLQAPGARVADIGCGVGWAAIAIAQSYPAAKVDGYDADRPSIELARQNAEAAGVADRVSFHVADAARLGDAGGYDLVLILEALHDMARPVEALAAVRRMLAPGGSLIVMDERVEEEFKAPGSPTEQFFYAASVLFCLPTGLAEKPSAGTGAVMRPATLRNYARQAGFTDIEILPIEHDFFRLYCIG